MLGENENQFSLTRAMPSKGGRAKSDSRSVYREAVREASRRVEYPLTPDSACVGSVRMRMGTNVHAWSTNEFQKGGRLICRYADGVEGHN